MTDYKMSDVYCPIDHGEISRGVSDNAAWWSPKCCRQQMRQPHLQQVNTHHNTHTKLIHLNAM